MPSRPPVHRHPGHQTVADRRRDHDRKRGSSAQRGYGGRWQRARLVFLNDPANALCRMCLAEGRTTAADTVDHVTPHKGDQTLFWDRSNWQALCKWHHDSAKKSQEMTGRIPGVDINGEPLDPSHPWRTGR